MTVKVVGVVAHIGVVKVEELTPNFEEVTIELKPSIED